MAVLYISLPELIDFPNDDWYIVWREEGSRMISRLDLSNWKSEIPIYWRREDGEQRLRYYYSGGRMGNWRRHWNPDVEILSGELDTRVLSYRKVRLEHSCANRWCRRQRTGRYHQGTEDMRRGSPGHRPIPAGGEAAAAGQEGSHPRGVPREPHKRVVPERWNGGL